MVQHARTELPNECCGLLAGVREGDALRVLAWHPLINKAASPTRYLSDDESIVNAYRAMRDAGHEIMAVYHSHPTSEPIPSPTDLEWEYYAFAIHFIVGLSGPEPLVRGWWLNKNAFEEAAWRIVEA